MALKKNPLNNSFSSIAENTPEKVANQELEQKFVNLIENIATKARNAEKVLELVPTLLELCQETLADNKRLKSKVASLEAKLKERK